MLDYLRNQREQTDPELLKKLGWTPDQLREFAERWEKARQLGEADPLQRRRYEEELESLGLRPDEPAQTRALDDAADAQRGLQDAGNRTAAPLRFREAFENYRRNLSK